MSALATEKRKAGFSMAITTKPLFKQNLLGALDGLNLDDERDSAIRRRAPFA